MKSFLLSSLKHQIAVFAIFALAIGALWYLAAVLATLDEWQVANARAKKWDAGQGDRCTTLFSAAEQEVQAIDRGRCRLRADADAYFTCDKLAPSQRGLCRLKAELDAMSSCNASEALRRAELVAATLNSDCPHFSSGGTTAHIPTLAPQRPPGPLALYALEANGTSILGLFTAYLTLLAGMTLTGDIAKRFLVDNHVGWWRLTLVASIVSAACILGWCLYQNIDPEKALAGAFVAFCVAGIATVYGRATYRWVAKGFSGDTFVANTAPTVHQKNLGATKLVTETTSEPKPPSVAQMRASSIQAMATVGKFWPRLWARCIDLTLCWIVASAIGSVLPEIRAIFPNLLGVFADLIVGMTLLCGTVFFYESVLISRFGTTPGKALFGLYVISADSGFPSIAAAKQRAWTYLKLGLYLCFYVPFLQIFGAFTAWRRGDISQPWDLAARTVTLQTPIGPLRFVFATLLAISLFALMLGASRVAKEMTKDDIRRAVLR